MRHVSTFILILWTINCLATGQSGELIIYKGDTLTMLCEPLEIYLQQNEPREKFYPFLKDGCSTALWRGYVGLWEIKENRLFLIDVFACGDKTKSIKDKIFKGLDLEIFADWFEGQLFIEKGKVIKYNHMGYDRYYEKEIVTIVKNGIVVSEAEYINGVKPNDNRFSRDPKDIQAAIYKGINWDKLPKLSKDKKLFITIKIDEEGRIGGSEINGQIENEYKDEIKKIIKDFPTIQVFYSRGQPIKEGWVIPIFFNKENRRRYAR
jgi:hypothetical protein